MFFELLGVLEYVRTCSAYAGYRLKKIHLHFGYAHLQLVSPFFSCLAFSCLQLFRAHYVDAFYGAVRPDNLSICLTINMLTDFCIDLRL